MKAIKKIVFIGTGNVSWHLSRAFFDNGFTVSQIFGRNQARAIECAKRVNAQAVTDFKSLNLSADLYLLCIKDNSIQEVAQKLQSVKGIVAHTSGTVSIDALSSCLNFGVFYPLQSFSKDITVNFKNLPVLIEGNDDDATHLLLNTAKIISNSTFLVSSEKRENLHLAAVFVNNFSNHLFKQAYEICKENDLPFEVLHALISETARKAQLGNPAEMQTGPAKRGDDKTIQKHLELLNKAEQKKLYAILTESIKEQYET